MAIGNSLNIKMQQKFAPSQILLMKLLQIPNASLDDRIKEEVEKNPLLEQEDNKDEEKDISQVVPLPKADISGRIKNKNIDKKIEKFRTDLGDFNSTKESMYEGLLSQLSLVNMSEIEFEIGKEIIGNIDDNGYLVRSTDAIADDFYFSHNEEINKSEVEKILHIIQNFEPIGVGARDLKECLNLQIKRQKISGKGANIAAKIVDNDLYFNLFTKRQFDQIISKIGCTSEDLKSAEKIIRALNPKPSISDDSVYENIYITPDFYVWNDEGKVEFQLNKTSNKTLKISSHYAKMLEQLKGEKKKENKQAIDFIKNKMESAVEFIDAINRRDETLKDVMAAIIKFQYAYFLEGDISKLKPMRLVDIAEMTDNDISTISRVARDKYAQTHFGLFQLKQFFSNAVENQDGEQISSDTIKSIIVSHIEKEDKSHPLTDDKLVDILKSEGFDLARRTIAKYRTALHIPVARLRKTIQ